jgi:hypothetical protein
LHVPRGAKSRLVQILEGKYSWARVFGDSVTTVFLDLQGVSERTDTSFWLALTAAVSKAYGLEQSSESTAGLGTYSEGSS